jgi:hypothetical protein
MYAATLKQIAAVHDCQQREPRLDIDADLAMVLAEPEPITLPRLYKIAHGPIFIIEGRRTTVRNK